MRNYQAYKWEDILEEYVPRTMIGLKLITREKENEKKAYDNIDKRIPRRR